LEQPTSQVFSARNQLGLITLAVLVGFSVAAVFVALYIARSIVTPIRHLAEGAEAIAREDFSVVVDVSTQDEIGLTANAFNQMTSRLREFIGSLEQRVEERTKVLTNVAEISTATSSIQNLEKMLETFVHLTQQRFGLYHAHVFLFDEKTESLNIIVCGWKEGDEHKGTHGTTSIPLHQEQSLVARAARTKNAVIVNDVHSDPGWLPNPLLPDTASEMAVPLLVGDEVLGVLDVQSDQINAFTEADANVQTTLASQVAISLQNAQSYTELEHSQSQLSEALRVARLGNWEYDLEKDLFTFNDQFYSIFRTTAEKVGGYKLSSADYARNFVHPEDAPLVGAEIQRALASKERYFRANLEHRIIFENGEIGYIAVSVNVERDENGKIDRWYGANQDITERRRLEEINRRRASQQEAINLITQKIQNTTSVETALQIAARELGHALGMKPTAVTLETSALAEREREKKND
jgi:GAF domain-containing protein/HAMP domain-containing protein